VETYLCAAQILVAIVLIGVILLQVRGGGLGGIFGQADTTFRARRGMEKTLYQFTIALVIAFVVLAILSIRLV